ncbi:hypothetical protein [Phenylobacterium hankyongense]|uniref:hypothetical protein n=1 Tax=Phenylobacterium hankyongense TaxID=1813876 RepID=UPI001057E2F8|nr:hypothetical protein [Phenylobacterium hankyongense]
MKKILLAVASLAVVVSPVVASAQSYGHGRAGGWNGRDSQERSYDRGQGRTDYGRGYDRGRSGYGRDTYRDDSGAVVVAGLAGLLLGSALSGSQSQGYSQSYGYSQPYAYAPAYSQQRCGWQNQAYEDGYGDVQYRQVQICR